MIGCIDSMLNKLIVIRIVNHCDDGACVYNYSFHYEYLILLQEVKERIVYAMVGTTFKNSYYIV